MTHIPSLPKLGDGKGEGRAKESLCCILTVLKVCGRLLMFLPRFTRPGKGIAHAIIVISSQTFPTFHLRERKQGRIPACGGIELLFLFQLDHSVEVLPMGEVLKYLLKAHHLPVKVRQTISYCIIRSI